MSYVPPANPLEDPELAPYKDFLEQRRMLFLQEYERIRTQYGSLSNYSNIHTFLGMRKITDEHGTAFWLLREWMPAATDIWLTTDRIGFVRRGRYMFHRVPSEDGLPDGVWELRIPASEMPHGTYMELLVTSATTTRPVRRIPAFATWVHQDPNILTQWCARVWDPAEPYIFKHPRLHHTEAFPRIYEAHIGMAQAAYEGRDPDATGTYLGFIKDVLPRIKEGGYTAVQLMGILEHPLYKSFGYQVSGYYAVSSRFGTPDDFRRLVDAAHELGLAVILDIPHSHACPNTEQGIVQYDTTNYLFADKANQWGTTSFEYTYEMTRRFLLSNCRYWMDAFQIDGFRFDAVGNMVYLDHGVDDDFSHVGRCFYAQDGTPRIDTSGVLYLQLANTLVHEIDPHCITIAEEFSGMPGMTSAPDAAGLGFDRRFAMGLPDFWGKAIITPPPLGTMWYELTNHRPYERTISYVECHDQCINGKDAMIWRLIGDEMYEYMSVLKESWKVSRGVAWHKLMRLLTFMAAGSGYLTFMGNEFGHPEWLDAEEYGHRQWHLAETPHLKYSGLGAFDKAMLHLATQFPDAFTTGPQFLRVHEDDRHLTFQRGKLLVACNFHETRPQEHLNLMVPPGKYTELLSTDDPIYAGHGNLTITTPPTEHFSLPVGQDLQLITLYLPPLVALVLEKE